MSLPLEGVKVVEMAGLGPAPYGVMLLADLGADVVRVDRSLVADGLSVWSEGLSRGRRSICLDVRNSDGLQSVAGTGRPRGRVRRVVLGPASQNVSVSARRCAAASNPGLLYARMSGWGQDGPWAQRAGHDLGYIALAGALFNIGYPTVRRSPRRPWSGTSAAGAPSWRWESSRGCSSAPGRGVGQVIDAAVLDGAASLTTFSHGLRSAGALTDRRGDSIADGSVPFYSTYETRDGKYVTVAALEPHFYAEFMAGLGVDPEGRTRKTTGPAGRRCATSSPRPSCGGP